MLNTYRLAYPTCVTYSRLWVSPCQTKFNHSGINIAKWKVMTLVSNTDSKGHSAAFHTVTLLFITFTSHECKGSEVSGVSWHGPSALPLSPEFPPVQRGLTRSPLKNWGGRRKWWQGARVNDRKTPAANTVCSKPWTWGRRLFLTSMSDLFAF